MISPTVMSAKVLLVDDESGILESLKILLYGRLQRGLDDALGLYQRQGAARRAEVGAA